MCAPPIAVVQRVVTIEWISWNCWSSSPIPPRNSVSYLLLAAFRNPPHTVCVFLDFPIKLSLQWQSHFRPAGRTTSHAVSGSLGDWLVTSLFDEAFGSKCSPPDLRSLHFNRIKICQYSIDCFLVFSHEYTSASRSQTCMRWANDRWL